MILIHLWKDETKGFYFSRYRMRERFTQSLCFITTFSFLGLGVTIERGEHTPTNDQTCMDWFVEQRR